MEPEQPKRTPSDSTAIPPRPPIGAGTALLLLDGGLAVVVWLAATVLSGPSVDPLALLLVPAGYVLFLYALGLHRRDALMNLGRSSSRVPLAAGLGALLAWAMVAVLPMFGVLPLPLIPATALGCCAAGLAARASFSLLRHRQIFHRRVLIVGAGKQAWDLVWLLRNEGRALNYDIAFAVDNAAGLIDERLAAEPGNHIIPASGSYLSVARSFGADEIVVALDERRGMPVQLLLACRTAGFPVTEYLTFLEREIHRIDIKRLELSWLLYADGFTFGLIDRGLKRLLDIVVSATVLLLSSPFLLAAALAVKLGDRGPVLYRQARVTRGGQVFRIMKLRTMRVDAERHGAVWAAKADPRITRIGNFLRRTRLDELPQLLNILSGDMSFVGPRPERPEFVAGLIEQLPLYAERHVVKAGLTGWAQVNYPYGASLDDARSKLSYDLYYVKNFSVMFDLLIIMQTIRVVLWPDGVR